MNQTKTSKVVVITGCSSGFGLLTAARLSSRGYSVFATMRNLNKKQALLDEVKKRGGKVELLQLDVTDVSSIKRAIDDIKKRANRIDVLINNAGYGVGGFFEDLTDEQIRAQLEVNFFGAQNVTREVIPLMRTQGSGKIINLSSIAGLYALPNFGAYNASKWALEGFSESLYYELKPFGIHVALIEPGTYNTTIFRENKRYAKNFDNPQSPYFILSRFLNKKVNDYVSKIRRDPEDIARLIENIINTENPALRNFPDLQSKTIYALRRLLPFRIYSGILQRGLFQGFDFKKLKNPPD